MRISSISIAQPKNLNHNLRNRNVQTQPVSFHSWKTAGASGGALLGLGLGTLLSGGLLAPLLLASAGTAVGGFFGSSKDNNNSDTKSEWDYSA